MAELAGEDDGLASAEQSVDEWGTPIVKLKGELDMSSVGLVRGVIESAIEAASGRLIFDLSDLDFMDSSGIAALLVAAKRVDSVEIRHPTPIVRRILESTGLAAVFAIEDR